MAFCLWLPGLAGAAEAPAHMAPELVTNLSQILRSDPGNKVARRLVSVQLQGTVHVGGRFGSVVVLAGAPDFYPLPATVEASPLRRGQRIQITGRCLVDGTNLFLGPQPLVNNDGLHIMYDRPSAGLWLEAGRSPIRVRYFNSTGDRGLSVFIEGPGLSRQKIPDAMLCRSETNPATGDVFWTNGVRFKSYEGVWSRLPDFTALQPVAAGGAANFDIGVAGRDDHFGLEFNGFIELPQAGYYIVSCTSDDGSQVDVGAAGLAIQTLGAVALPELPRQAAGQLIVGEADLFCAALEGVVSFAEPTEGGLILELASGRGRATVQLNSTFKLDSRWLVGARVLAQGLCQSGFTPEGYQVAGQLTVYSDENLQVLDLPERVWISQPMLNSGQIAANLRSNPPSQLVRVRGIWNPNRDAAGIQDAAGEIFLSLGSPLAWVPGTRVEALGMAGLVNQIPTLRCYALRKIAATGDDEARELPLLTTIKEVKEMGRDEARKGYPVQVRGIVTYVYSSLGLFLQDATRAINVLLVTNAASSLPKQGEYWEIEGKTFPGFAPNILATRATRLGLGTMPDPVHPNWTELMDGSLDTQYIEVQGVVLSAEGHVLNLQMPSGIIKPILPAIPSEELAKTKGALVRVRGCLIPGRDLVTQQVKLGEFSLRHAMVLVDEPAPADPFALPLKRATDLLLFDSHASPIQRARLQGLVLQQHAGVTYLLDQTNGLRVMSESSERFRPGDRVEVVGFPDLTGPAPLFNNALIRKLDPDREPLPEAVAVAGDKLLDSRLDSTRVTIEGMLLSQRNGGWDQILEMRSGTRVWLARLPLRANPLPALALESVLKLTGVYVGQGGDRTRGRDINSFELLLNSPQDVLVMRSPSWWTTGHALAVAGALLAVLLLAVIWIGALHRQVEERTRALKNEIQERLRIEAEVERGHKQLLVTSRLAGMAEVATSVLHNVGNVMTSVNVLSASIVELVRNSKISSVARLGELLGQNRHQLDRFVREDERGRKMPDYVDHLSAHLVDEQSVLLQKVNVLNENIHHINEIVAMQQNHAKVSGLLETLPPEEVVEDALRMHGESIKRHGIKLVRDYERIPALTMDRHKVLQILFNLLENAKYACLQGGARDKQIVVRLQRTGAGLVQLTVADNGMGIPPENLARLFGQGFSTRKDGHGFGLHSSILAAQDMGGTLTAHSAGRDQGAVFKLEIPPAPGRPAPPPQT